MNKRTIGILLAALLLSSPALAAPAEPGYVPDERVSTPWFSKQDEARRAADLEFIAGMRPHHEGALTMSEEYLNDNGAENAQLKQLARGIYHNQKFEIGVLNEIEGFVSRPLRNDAEERRVATKGLGQVQKFYRMPIPGPWDEIEEGPGSGVSARDVAFAKGMIVHHQAALDMAHAYLDNPAGRNGYLRRMCLDIILDQTQEIAFMRKIIGLYPGDPNAVPSSMVYGMDHMEMGSMGHMDMKGMDHSHMNHEARHGDSKKVEALKPEDKDMSGMHHDMKDMPAEQQEQPENWFNILRKLKKE